MHGALFMAEPLSADRLRDAVGDLVELVQATTRAEAEIKRGFAGETESADRAYQQAKSAIDERLSANRQKIAEEFQSRRKQIKSDFDRDYAETKKEGEERLAGIISKARKNE